MKTRMICLDALSDDALLDRVADLVGHSRRVEAELVAHLAEVDRRRLYLREACPSMHVYATARLHLSDAEAYLRITAARLSRRFPVVLSMLADGKLHLSAIAKLAPHLREQDGEELLARAAHRSKREIAIIVAGLAPRPDVPSSMRRLPAQPEARAAVRYDELRPDGVLYRDVSERPAAVSVAERTTAGRDPASQALAEAAISRTAHDATVSPDGTAAAGPVPAAGAASASITPSAAARQQGVIAPIAPSRYRVQFTAGAELHDKIERARALLRHQIPDGDLGALFDRAMTLLVRDLERARFAATKSPRKAAHQADPRPSSRRIPDPIKRAVWLRDQEQCTFRDRKGRRCPARERLEFHHLVPFGQGGDHSPSNLALRCAAHNAEQANADFGAAFMAGKRKGTRASERRATYGGRANPSELERGAQRSSRTRSAPAGGDASPTGAWFTSACGRGRP